MTKGNVLNNRLRGKVGDVVFYVRAGEQIMRARNRNPYNPNTNGQIYSKAMMASILAMYKAGKDIFRQAFQGQSGAKGNYCRFMALNCRALKQCMISDLDASTGGFGESRCVDRKASSPAPWEYYISEGELTQSFIEIWPGRRNVTIYIPGFEEGQSLASYLKVGEVFTVVMVGVLTGDLQAINESPTTSFAWMRLECINTDVTYHSGLRLDEVFALSSSNGSHTLLATFDEWYNLNNFVTSIESCAAAGVIQSFKNSPVRSTSRLVCMSNKPWGLVLKEAFKQWGGDPQQDITGRFGRLSNGQGKYYLSFRSNLGNRYVGRGFTGIELAAYNDDNFDRWYEFEFSGLTVTPCPQTIDDTYKDKYNGVDLITIAQATSSIPDRYGDAVTIQLADIVACPICTYDNFVRVKQIFDFPVGSYRIVDTWFAKVMNNGRIRIQNYID